MVTSNKKTKLSRILAVFLVFAVAIAGAYAFLTAITDTLVNNFTIGSIKVELDEGPWENYPDTDNDGVPDIAENVVSGQIIEKAPSVKNLGANNAFAFLVVAVPKADAIIAAVDGTLTRDTEGNPVATTDAELFSFITKDASGVNTTDWTLIDSDNTKADYNYYVYSYGSLAPEAQTNNLFDKVKFANVTEDFAGATHPELIVKVTAVAIQADENITTADKAWTALSGDDAFVSSNIYPGLSA